MINVKIFLGVLTVFLFLGKAEAADTLWLYFNQTPYDSGGTFSQAVFVDSLIIPEGNSGASWPLVSFVITNNVELDSIKSFSLVFPFDTAGIKMTLDDFKILKNSGGSPVYDQSFEAQSLGSSCNNTLLGDGWRGQGIAGGSICLSIAGGQFRYLEATMNNRVMITKEFVTPVNWMGYDKLEFTYSIQRPGVAALKQSSFAEIKKIYKPD